MNRVEIYIFRHGETDWNRERRLQGHTDIPLNETGRNQARELAKKVFELKPELILSSDLSRALETATIVNSLLQVPMHLSDHLRECRMGEPEGMLRDEVLALYGQDAWDRWISVKEADQDFVFKNGESKREHLMRMTAYIEGFLSQNPGLKKIAVSTHGASLRRLAHHCEGAPQEGISLPNCALYKLTFDLHSKKWNFESPL
ncbi:histidine phosphatase family protein [Bdellovibrio sp. HCB2-146]|uniref:histidine phosphatase family protein n=1 Tax=Bdellovibrio sp. HCB2-146 TaxID=3394362 RepID=UPI0039BC7281